MNIYYFKSHPSIFFLMQTSNTFLRHEHENEIIFNGKMIILFNFSIVKAPNRINKVYLIIIQYMRRRSCTACDIYTVCCFFFRCWSDAVHCTIICWCNFLNILHMKLVYVNSQSLLCSFHDTKAYVIHDIIGYIGE